MTSGSSCQRAPGSSWESKAKKIYLIHLNLWICRISHYPVDEVYHMGKTDQTDGGDEEVAEIETFVGAVRLLDDLVVKVIQYH